MGVGEARRKRVMPSETSFPSTSNDSASSAGAPTPPSLLLPPLALSPSTLSSSAATVRATVSMALEMRDFSLAARTAEASTPVPVLLPAPLLLAAAAAMSPLLEPFSVECLLSASASRWEEEKVEEAPPSGEARLAASSGEGEGTAWAAWAWAAAAAPAASRVSGAMGVRGSMVGESPLYMLYTEMPEAAAVVVAEREAAGVTTEGEEADSEEDEDAAAAAAALAAACCCAAASAAVTAVGRRSDWTAATRGAKYDS